MNSSIVDKIKCIYWFNYKIAIANENNNFQVHITLYVKLMIENRTDKLIIELTKAKLKGSLHDPLFGGIGRNFEMFLQRKRYWYMNSNMVNLVYHLAIFYVYLRFSLFTSTSAGGVLHHLPFLAMRKVANVFNTFIFVTVFKLFALLCVNFSLHPRLGDEEKASCVVTTRLLLSKASD